MSVLAVVVAVVVPMQVAFRATVVPAALAVVVVVAVVLAKGSMPLRVMAVLVAMESAK
jgi:hypothetical protein